MKCLNLICAAALGMLCIIKPRYIYLIKCVAFTLITLIAELRACRRFSPHWCFTSCGRMAWWTLWTTLWRSTQTTSQSRTHWGKVGGQQPGHSAAALLHSPCGGWLASFLVTSKSVLMKWQPFLIDLHQSTRHPTWHEKQKLNMYVNAYNCFDSGFWSVACPQELILYCMEAKVEAEEMCQQKPLNQWHWSERIANHSFHNNSLIY